mmetsp:Transcript_25945/g.65421  ORF Transcript_25945/g.65421 Transcript_25945/m.65421 type:complete len:306 (-) Transcript_25945:398-1315(-)|eukprot:CAMPEP_0178989952 /NCGR_PEP_ID=MMETSP0795-20121207/4661_1 /TAXON_ID=88552 /ORGANISM="Amoebophrya sp., Strain Ameob2" /LENGTH=305 /DNA_ID=CAMNT_0020681413 /DNA_START=179 /DNA_END=1099 /DNA_ORIENTATION=-
MLRVVLARTFLFLAPFGFDVLAFTTQETQRPCQKKVRVKGASGSSAKGGKGGAAGGAIEYAFALYPYCFVGGNEVPPEWTGENSDKDPTGRGACVMKESAIPAALALIAAGLVSLGLNCYLLIYRRTPPPEPLPKSLTPEEVDALVKKQVDTAVDTLKLEEKKGDVDTSSENEKDKAARQRNDDFIHNTFPGDGAANKSEEGKNAATAAVADKGCCERTITSCFTTCGAKGEKTTPGKVVTATPAPASVVAATPTPASTVVAATPTPATVVAATPTPAAAVASTTPVTTAVPVAGTTPAPGMAAE